ncbi:MAG: hypothetical protein EXR98_09585 [Gemmataceae bacterium]|nr:hypothetical protein [Gemmataceae bacterium]
MSRFQFELAGPDDDADLRHVLAATPMAGRMAVSFRREPSWFGGAVVDGFSRQVVGCRDQDTGRIVGFGCRSLRELYVNGEPRTIGYLSSLRLLPEHRNRGLIARGYAYFHRLHADGRTPFYLTTIADGNEAALAVLTSGRARLPAYHPAGRFHTIAIALPQRKASAAPSSAIRVAQAADLPAVVEFLNTVGPRRQFFPVYRAEAFLSPDGLLRGLELDRLLLAERGGRIVGMLTGWDQRAFRQQIVHGYSTWLRCVRPIYNLTARLRGTARLPATGEPLPTLMGALPLVADDDVAVFGDLLGRLRDLCGGKRATHLLLGLHERDPLFAVARRFQAACYTSLLFLVCWPDGDTARLALDGRKQYLELGSL